LELLKKHLVAQSELSYSQEQIHPWNKTFIVMLLSDDRETTEQIWGGKTC